MHHVSRQVDPCCAAELLATAICQKSEEVLRQCSVGEEPEVLAAHFGLLAEAVRPSSPSGPGPCQDRLRPLMLSRLLIARCLSLVSLVLPDCCSERAVVRMLRFAKHLMSTEEAEPGCPTVWPWHRGRPRPEAHATVLRAAFPSLCAALCRALAMQDFFSEAEAAAEAGELLLSAALAGLPTGRCHGNGLKIRCCQTSRRPWRRH